MLTGAEKNNFICENPHQYYKKINCTLGIFYKFPEIFFDNVKRELHSPPLFMYTSQNYFCYLDLIPLLCLPFELFQWIELVIVGLQIIGIQGYIVPCQWSSLNVPTAFAGGTDRHQPVYTSWQTYVGIDERLFCRHLCACCTSQYWNERC